MAQYEPQIPQGIRSVDDLTRYLFNELQELARCLGGVETIVLSKRNVTPEKTVDGNVQYADGTNWNPDSGPGIYFWNGATWQRLVDGREVANGTVAVTITSLGPTGAQTTIQGWFKVKVDGNDRFIPFW
jgi:hypothetical protein